MAKRRSCVNVAMKAWLWLPRIDERLWWWLALVSIVALLGQEICRSSALALASASVAEFEGFGEEWEDGEDDAVLVVPPPVLRQPGFETDHGPPEPPHVAPETTIPPRMDDSPEPPAHEAVAVEDSSASTTQKAPRQPPRHDYWDEDEFEGLPEEENVEDHSERSSADLSSADQTAQKHTPPRGPQSYYIEIICIIFLVAFAIAYFLGRKQNEKIALAWAAQFTCKDSIFEKNFSLLGTGMEADAPLLIKEGQNLFKFYASGRRYCMGLLATLDLQSRHDLITCMWYLVSRKKDEITIDVFLNDDSMDPITFALVRKKDVKAMLKGWRDLQLYAAPVTQRKGLSEELAAISESRDLVADLLTDVTIDQVFGEKAFEKYGNYFLSLHFSDQFPLGSHKKVLRFQFIIPPMSQMSDMSRLIALVPYFIDLVGRYKLNAQLRAKADSARVKVANEAFKEAQSARQEALQKKKEERRKALESSESRPSAEALRKREEKERLRQMKKAMPRIKMTRA